MKILEVGTWNGERAIEMLRNCPEAFYYGFDLFEDATDEIDTREFNVKPHFSMDEVSKMLKMIIGERFKLCKGNTKETLPEFTETIDFAFIDGGHSVGTIQSDFDNILRIMSKDGVIVFDDYYTDMPDARLSEVGCNRVIQNLPHTILPKQDSVIDGGKVQMVYIEMSKL